MAGSPYTASLEACLNGIGSCNTTLGAARTALSAVTEDYDRLSRVLAVRQAYDLVTVDEINDSLLSLKRAVEPQIHELISLAESGLTELQKRERSLYEQVERRKMQAATAAPLTSGSQHYASSPMSVQFAEKQAKLMALQTKKEALLKAMERNSIT